MNLSDAQRSTLSACADWAAPYEVMMWRHLATDEIICPSGQQQILGRLRNLGLLEYGMCNDTYRVTPAGALILAEIERRDRLPAAPTATGGR